jgi:hypothetical protein
MQWNRIRVVRTWMIFKQFSLLYLSTYTHTHTHTIFLIKVNCPHLQNTLQRTYSNIMLKRRHDFCDCGTVTTLCGTTCFPSNLCIDLYQYEKCAFKSDVCACIQDIDLEENYRNGSVCGNDFHNNLQASLDRREFFLNNAACNFSTYNLEKLMSRPPCLDGVIQKNEPISCATILNRDSYNPNVRSKHSFLLER